MAARIIGSVENIVAEIAQFGGRIRREVNDQLEREARQIQTIAREMVPRLDRDMERAIKVDSANQRRRWLIYVDENAPTTIKGEGRRYTVGDYLLFLHEGDYQLGKQSVEKQKTTQYRVGRKFLERAFEAQLRDRMIERVTEAARRAGVL